MSANCSLCQDQGANRVWWLQTILSQLANDKSPCGEMPLPVQYQIGISRWQASFVASHLQACSRYFYALIQMHVQMRWQIRAASSKHEQQVAATTINGHTLRSAGQSGGAASARKHCAQGQLPCPAACVGGHTWHAQHWTEESSGPHAYMAAA